VRVEARPLSAFEAARTLGDMFGSDLTARWRTRVADVVRQDVPRQVPAGEY
jgi:hypothetical protein